MISLQISWNDAIQWTIAIIILILAALWVLRRVLRKDNAQNDCGCGCSDCPIARECKKKDLKR